MRPLMRVAVVVLVAACSDPTRVAPAPTIGAIAGVILIQSDQHPAVGVQVTIKSSANATYSAADTTDSLGRFFQNNVPAGIGQLQMRKLPTGCDSVLVAPFGVNGGLVDSTTVELPCGA
jgi:hypothetical protein